MAMARTFRRKSFRRYWIFGCTFGFSTMSNSKIRKNRGPNFTADERELIIHLVSQHKDVVENKKTDAVTTASKNEEWARIAEEFNSISSFCVRTSEQIKTCWENIKRTTRKDKASTKRETFLTGGGRPNQSPPGPLQGQVEAILGPTLDGLINPYDSDAHYSEGGGRPKQPPPKVETILGPTTNGLNTYDTHEAIVITEVHPIECSIVEMETDGTSASASQHAEGQTVVSEKENNWNGWSPAALRTKVSNKLTKTKSPSMSELHMQRRRPKCSLQDNLIEKKIELVEIAKKNLEEEAKFKMKLLEEQLKQEKIKTQILEVQLETLKK